MMRKTAVFPLFAAIALAAFSGARAADFRPDAADTPLVNYASALLARVYGDTSADSPGFVFAKSHPLTDVTNCVVILSERSAEFSRYFRFVPQPVGRAHDGRFEFFAVRRDREDIYRTIRDGYEKVKARDQRWLDGLARETLGTEPSGRRVRVAVYNEKGAFEEDVEGVARGCTVDYLRAVCAKTRWDLDLVYCSFANALEYVSDGSVDLVHDLLVTPERSDAMLFTHVPAGFRREYLFTRSSSALLPDVPESWNGCRVGVLRNYTTVAQLENSLAALAVRHTIIEYDAVDQLERALFTGECDAVLCVSTEALRDQTVLITLPRQLTFFAVSKTRPDLFSELERTLLQIYADDPDFNESLQREHYPVVTRNEVPFTNAEMVWKRMQTHGGRPLRVDCSAASAAFMTWNPELETAAGFIPMLFGEISESEKLDFDFMKPASREECERRLIGRESDIWVDFMRHGGTENERITRFEMPLDLPQVVTRRRGAPEKALRESRIAIAAADEARVIAYSRLGLHENLVMCKSPTEAFNLVLKGEADCVFSSIFSAQTFKRDRDWRDVLEIQVLPHPSYVPTVSFHFSSEADPAMISYIRKSIERISPETMQTLLYRSTTVGSAGRQTMSREERVLLFIGVPFAALLVILAFFACARVRVGRAFKELGRVNGKLETEHARLVQLLDENERQRKELADAARDAEIAAKSTSRFLATMSHEIRTPLNAVIGYSQFLNQPGIAPDEVLEYGGGIYRSANALLALINNILDLSKIEDEHFEMRGGELDIRKTFDELQSVFGLRMRSKHIQFETVVADAVPKYLDLAANRVSQILLNLVGNAVKFTQNGTIAVHAMYADGALRLTVSDTGSGISPEKIDSIFDPYVQDERGASKQNSTGLGLAIVKRLADSAGGNVSVSSSVGVGTVFEVVLPSQPKTVAGAGDRGEDQSTQSVAHAESKRLLIVDDVPLNLRVLGLHLRNIGMKDVTAVGSGREALHRLNTEKFDAVFTDVWMPEITGPELAVAMHENPDIKDIPIVAITADIDAAASFDVSAFTDILTKPVTQEKLRAEILKLFPA